MAKLIGYGEDSLTLWALTKNYAKFKEMFKQKFNDNLDEATVFYRPSFGRGGKSDKNFGEFDAVIVSSEKVYLVESKWNNSSEIRKSKSTIVLREEQKLRYDILREYLKVWQKIVFENGKKIDEKNEYYNNLKDLLGKKLIEILSVNDANTTLFSNINKVAEIIIKNGIDCENDSKYINLVLYFHFEPENNIYKIVDTKGEVLEFEVLNISYKESDDDKDRFVNLAEM